MDTNTLTTPTTTAKAAYQSRSLHTGVAPFVLCHANIYKYVPFLITCTNVL